MTAGGESGELITIGALGQACCSDQRKVPLGTGPSAVIKAQAAETVVMRPDGRASDCVVYEKEA